MTRASPKALTLLMLLCMLPALVQALEVEGAYLRELPPGQTTSAMYMTLRNTDDGTVQIVGARVDAVDTAEIHEHRHEDGMMRMQRVEALDIAPGASVALAPGGYHLMLIKPKKPFKKGDTLTVTLHTAHGYSKAVNMEVKERPSGEAHQHHQ